MKGLRSAADCGTGAAAPASEGSACDPSRRLRERRITGFSATRRRHLGLLVLVIRVTGRAARLLDLVFNHGDDRMIGDAALARTVVVENVTEPKPALLHDSPGPIPFKMGWMNRRAQVLAV